MKLILCVDERMGFSFFGKRLSRDIKATEKIFELVGNNPLFATPFSETVLGERENVVYKDNPFCEDGFVFAENLLPDNFEKVNEIFLFNWNRKYPYDKALELEKEKAFTLCESEDFCGNSHEKITLCHYVKEVKQ